jgi:hypothetical protein
MIFTAKASGLFFWSIIAALISFVVGFAHESHDKV